MKMVQFEKRNCCLVNNVYNASLWLKGAIVGGKEILVESSVVGFLLKLEEMEGYVLPSDLSWVNNICRTCLGRDYKQPEFKDKGGDKLGEKLGDKRKNTESSSELNEAVRQIGLQNDRASIRR